MITIISSILIFIALAIIAAIIIKKFPTLAILDVNNMPSEKEAKFKDAIMKARLERDISRWSGVVGRFFLRLNRYFSQVLHSAQENLKKVKLNYKASAKIPVDEKQEIIRKLARQAEELIKEEEFAEAEDKLVEIISLDQKNLWAFFELGGVYEELKKYPEARQTYEYALKLAKQARPEDEGLDLNPQEIYFTLAWLEQSAGNLEAAFDNALEALEFEPNSPRYLDLILDLSIMRKDKVAAWKYFEKLAAANPENNKLVEIREKIAEMSEAPTEEAG